MARPRRRAGAAWGVFVFGAGKVGRALARALRKAGVRVKLRAARKGLPRVVHERVVVLAVREGQLRALVEAMAARPPMSRAAVVVHVSGALDDSVLAPLRVVCAGVAQMHPMISFASKDFSPDVRRGNVLVRGDTAAATKARAIARALGMTPRSIGGLDGVAYHAAAGLVANGAAALAAVGAELLVRAGVAKDVAPKMLGPLLRSVAENVETLGFPDALTGPVRRGDAAGVERHLAALRAKMPSAVDLYVASGKAQLPLARALGDAPGDRFDAVDEVLTFAQNQRQD